MKIRPLLVSVLLPACAFGLMVGIATGATVYMPVQGGTGTSTKPVYGQLLVGNSNGTYTLTATSSLGITGSAGSSFSTTSALFFSSLGLAFSTTSNDHWQTQRNFFSTTSANAWSVFGLGFSTTSANYWSSLGLGFSTTSANLWRSLGLSFSTTSSNAWSAVGLGFSTTSVDYWETTQAPRGGGGSPFAWTPAAWGNSTSTTIGFVNGLLSTASSTFIATTTFTTALQIGASPLDHAFTLVPSRNYSASNSVGGALFLDNTNNTGSAATIYSNQASPAAGANLLSLFSDNTGATTDVIDVTYDGQQLGFLLNCTNTTACFGAHLQVAGTSGGSYNLKLTGPAPQIEWDENDQSSPVGDWETGVTGDTFYIASRNAANTSYESTNLFMLQPLRDGGVVGIGSSTPFATLGVKATTTLPAGKAIFAVGDSNNTNLFTIRPSGATTTNLQLTDSLYFGGVSGNSWDDFCTVITGGSGLCDGDDADTTYTAGDGLTLTANDIDCDTASAAALGCLAATDWSVFNNKVSTTSIDTITEVETLWGVSNILVENDIDASSELAALMDDETGTAGNLVFSTAPTLAGFVSSASSTLSGNATTTGNHAFGTVRVPLLTSALLVTNANGLFAEYAGSNCTNQAATAISALGAATCTTLTPAYLDMTTTWDFGGAAGFEMPNGTNPTVDAIGEHALDITSNIFLVATSTNASYPQTYRPDGRLKFAALATSTLTRKGSYGTAGTSTILIAGYEHPITFKSARCVTDPISGNGTTTMRIGDGTNWTEFFLCDDRPNGISTGLATNVTFSAGEEIQIQIGTRISNPDFLSLDAPWAYTRD